MRLSTTLCVDCSNIKLKDEKKMLNVLHMYLRIREHVCAHFLVLFYWAVVVVVCYCFGMRERKLSFNSHTVLNCNHIFNFSFDFSSLLWLFLWVLFLHLRSSHIWCEKLLKTHIQINMLKENTETEKPTSELVFSFSSMFVVFFSI